MEQKKLLRLDEVAKIFDVRVGNVVPNRGSNEKSEAEHGAQPQ